MAGAVRHCFACNREIHACMGFVLARDFLACLRGEWLDEPRELCGRCGVYFIEPELLHLLLDY